MSLIKKNLKFIILLVFISSVVYFNALGGEFLVVDDIPAFVENEEIRNLPKAIRTLQLQNIVYSLCYNFFGIKPFPLHFFSLLFHITITILAFVSTYILFGKRIAKISSLLFAVHPVNTEAVSWISGSPYLHHALFFYLTLIPYLIFKKSKRALFFFVSLGVFSLGLVLVRSPWLFTIPLALLVIDQFVLEKKVSFKPILRLFTFIVPMLIYSMTSFPEEYLKRVSSLRVETSIPLGQSILKSIIEGYAYTVYTMLRLYTFPINQTIYYEGNLITEKNYLLMLLVLSCFLFLIAYFWKKNRQMTGLLIILPILTIFSFSPLKITWLIAERYLYLGITFGVIFMAMLFLKLEEKMKLKHLSLYLTLILLIAYSFRTINRNKDWHDSISLGQATIKVSSNSPRPYNDLAGAYFNKGDLEQAVKYSLKALEIYPQSTTAMRNLGLVYLKTGLPEVPSKSTEEAMKIKPALYLQPFNDAREAFESQDQRTALYYLSKAQEINPYFVDPYDLAGIIYYKEGKLDLARAQLEKSLEINSKRDTPLYMLGMIELKQENLEKARECFIKTLTVNPNHLKAQEGLKSLQNLTP